MGSRVFPGLWLAVESLLAGEVGSVLGGVRQGTESAEHAQFIS